MRPDRTRPTALALLLSCVVAAVVALPARGDEGPGIGFRLETSKAKPKQAYFAAKRKPTLRYRFRAKRRTPILVQVTDKSGRVVAAYRRKGVEPGLMHAERWSGLTRRGKAARDGRYRWRVGPKGGRLRFAGSFRIRGHVFPVDGPHGTRGAIGEFGAPRSGGRTHEGFDITGACGTRLVLARGGKVKRVGYDPELYGYYVLVNGRKTNESYFYSHLIAPSPLRKGERAHTGARVGAIGRTGNAASTPCHLHFELRRNGRPVDPESELRDWDGWS